MRNQAREVRCNSCGGLNRVPSYSIHRIPWCGKCGTALPEHQVVKATRLSYRLGRLSLYYLLLGAFLAAFIGLLTLIAFNVTSDPTRKKSAFLHSAPPSPWSIQAIPGVAAVIAVDIENRDRRELLRETCRCDVSNVKNGLLRPRGRYPVGQRPGRYIHRKIRRWARIVWRG
jgi:hypothetical protein